MKTLSSTIKTPQMLFPLAAAALVLAPAAAVVVGSQARMAVQSLGKGLIGELQ